MIEIVNRREVWTLLERSVWALLYRWRWAWALGISFRSPLLPLGSGLCSAQTELTYIENSLPLSGGK